MPEPAEPSLRARLAEALRTAAFLCDDCCTEEDEAACDAAHPIQAAVLHFDQVADISGPVDAIAETMAAVVQPLLDAKDTEMRQLRAQLDALIAACDAEYAPPAGEQPVGIPALLDALADQMPALSPEEELDGWKRQSAWSHHMATRFNKQVWDLRAKVTWLAASHSDGLDLIIQLSDERDRLREQLTAAGGSAQATEQLAATMIPGIAACYSTRHCVNWGFCHRCAPPDFLAEVDRHWKASAHATEGGGDVYGAIVLAVAAERKADHV